MAPPPSTTLFLLLSFASSATSSYTDLFRQLGPPLPFPWNTSGYYRIPSLVAAADGSHLLAFVAGRFHRTDATPNIIYLRRSLDPEGTAWGPPLPILADPDNATEFGGAPVVDPRTGTIHYIHNAASRANGPCSACELRSISSHDDGRTWSAPRPLKTTGAPNTTFGGGLASGIALTRGAHAGRLLVALRHDCGRCSANRASFVVFSDDGGATWAGGAPMELLPQDGGGWTECQVAELGNGSVLMTSRNFYGASSGQGPRLFARSDDGGETWAANWTARELPDPFCEGSVLASPDRTAVYFGNPSNSRSRANYSVHRSIDGGRTWDGGRVVYGGGAAYSDMAFTRNGSLAVLFERDNSAAVSFALVGANQTSLAPHTPHTPPVPHTAAPSTLPSSLVLLDNAKFPLARCLDGSPSGYYWRSAAPGSNDTNKFLIVLEGGGLCTGNDDCTARAATDLGSSRGWSPTFDWSSTPLTTADAGNSFRGWNTLWVKVRFGGGGSLCEM